MIMTDGCIRQLVAHLKAQSTGTPPMELPAAMRARQYGADSADELLLLLLLAPAGMPKLPPPCWLNSPAAARPSPVPPAAPIRPLPLPLLLPLPGPPLLPAAAAKVRLRLCARLSYAGSTGGTLKGLQYTEAFATVLARDGPMSHLHSAPCSTHGPTYTRHFLMPDNRKGSIRNPSGLNAQANQTKMDS